MFQTLNEEQRIHSDILTIRTQPKQFCAYFLVQFVGTDVPKEMKAEGGFVMRGLASATWFQITEDLQGLYKSLGKKNKPKPMAKILDSYREGVQDAKLEELEQAIAKKQRNRTGNEEDEAERFAESAREAMLMNPTKFESLYVAYNYDSIKFIDDDKENPPDDTEGFHARILKIKPFSKAKIRRFHINDKSCDI